MDPAVPTWERQLGDAEIKQYLELGQVYEETMVIQGPGELIVDLFNVGRITVDVELSATPVGP